MALHTSMSGAAMNDTIFPPFLPLFPRTLGAFIRRKTCSLNETYVVKVCILGDLQCLSQKAKT